MVPIDGCFELRKFELYITLQIQRIHSTEEWRHRIHMNVILKKLIFEQNNNRQNMTFIYKVLNRSRYRVFRVYLWIFIIYMLHSVKDISNTDYDCLCPLNREIKQRQRSVLVDSWKEIHMISIVISWQNGRMAWVFFRV